VDELVFYYSAVDNRPYAFVEIRYGEQSNRERLLVDSGADFTVIRKNIGLALGFSLEENEEIKELGGIGGGIPAVFREVEMVIGEYRFSAKIAWALVENIPLILGQKDVFDHFNIEFRKSNRQVVFRWCG